MMRLIPVSVVALCLLSAATFGQATAPSYPESKQGLTQWAADLLAAAEAKDQAKTLGIFQRFMLKEPQKWFSEVFGDDAGARLAKEYSELGKFPVSMAALFLRLDKPTQLSIEVVMVDQSDDPNAKGYQAIALAAMKNPVPLYSLRIYKPGTNAQIGLWSIVYQDGNWHFAGKMKSVRE